MFWKIVTTYTKSIISELTILGKRPRGILITSLQPGSTAAEKLLVGDRIMAVNGTAITDQVVAYVPNSIHSIFLAFRRIAH